MTIAAQRTHPTAAMSLSKAKNDSERLVESTAAQPHGGDSKLRKKKKAQCKNKTCSLAYDRSGAPHRPGPAALQRAHLRSAGPRGPLAILQWAMGGAHKRGCSDVLKVVALLGGVRAEQRRKEVDAPPKAEAEEVKRGCFNHPQTYASCTTPPERRLQPPGQRTIP